jgi:hypothetical protein
MAIRPMESTCRNQGCRNAEYHIMKILKRKFHRKSANSIGNFIVVESRIVFCAFFAIWISPGMSSFNFLEDEIFIANLKCKKGAKTKLASFRKNHFATNFHFFDEKAICSWYVNVILILYDFVRVPKWCTSQATRAQERCTKPLVCLRKRQPDNSNQNNTDKKIKKHKL